MFQTFDLKSTFFCWYILFILELPLGIVSLLQTFSCHPSVKCFNLISWMCLCCIWHFILLCISFSTFYFFLCSTVAFVKSTISLIATYLKKIWLPWEILKSFIYFGGFNLNGKLLLWVLSQISCMENFLSWWISSLFSFH